MQAIQLLSRLDSRYFVSHSDSIVCPPELFQPVEELRAIIEALPAAVKAKRSTVDNVSCAAAEYCTVTETAENLLKSADDAAAKTESFATASEQLWEQQVRSPFFTNQPSPH